MTARSTQPLVRVTVIITLTVPQALVYASGVIAKLENDFEGTTFSRLPTSPLENSPFTGTYLQERERAEVLYREQITLVTVDADWSDNKAQTDFDGKQIAVNSRDSLILYLKTLKQSAEKVLEQDLVWITIQDVERIV